jgi:AraC family transcriptional regulator
LSGEQLACVRQYIRTNLTEDIHVAQLAALVRLSPHYFSQVFRQAVGVPPHRYVLRERIREAQQLLSAGAMSLAELATHLGFSDQSHFSRAFRKVTGMTPGAYPLKPLATRYTSRERGREAAGLRTNTLANEPRTSLM